MEQFKFKTSIKCNGCLEKVTPQLNRTEGIKNWEVDLKNPSKILTVNTENASQEDIESAVKKVGFHIERI